MTARRRGKGEGSIYRRASDGRWVAALIMDDGRRIVRRASSRKDAAAKLELLLKARAEGQAIAADRSAAAFLTDWLAVVRNTVALGTFERYEQYVRVHAIPPLGRIRLGRLTSQHFQRLYQEKLAAGLSPTTVSHLHTVLHGAFAEAVRWGLLSRNVVALARPPRKVHVEVVALTVEQAERCWPPPLALASRCCSSSRSRPACAVASCSPSAGRTSTSTRGAAGPRHPSPHP
jgi:integrase